MNPLKNAIMVGNGFAIAKMQQLLEVRRVRVIGYLILNPDEFGDIPGPALRTYQELSSWNFDYIVISSQPMANIYRKLLEVGIPNDKIINGLSFYKSYYFQNQVLTERPIELFITGLSYAQGIKERFLSVSSLNLAYPGQDLLLDYAMAKFVIAKRQKSLPKYAIVGLSYYSLNYEFSKTRTSSNDDTTFSRWLTWPGLVGRYAHTANESIGDARKLLFGHHVKEVQQYLAQSEDLVSPTAKAVWEYDPYLDGVYDPTSRKRSVSLERMSTAAIKVSEKHYPDSITRNKQILWKYVRLLREYGIQPIIVIHPQHEEYVRHFSRDMISLFRNVLSEIEEEYKIQIIDCFDSMMFGDQDFKDSDHLDEESSLRFTYFLNRTISW